MPDISYLAVLVATVAAFLLGGAYYAALGAQLAAVSDAAAAAGTPPLWELAVELLRSFLVAAVVAGLASLAGSDEWSDGLLLGIALWIGFPFVLWIGAVIHEKVPRKLAVIHAGDWLVKLLAVTVIVSVWQ